MKSAQWLGACQGLWLSLLCETGPRAEWRTLLVLLDALEDRAAGRTGDAEFARLFAAFAQQAGGPIGENGEVDAARFAAELGRRNVEAEHLAGFLALVTNEQNRKFVNELWAESEDSSVQQRLALAEKVFFSLDPVGKGYLTVDDVAFLACAERLFPQLSCSSMNRNGKSADRFRLADVASDSVSWLHRFGCDGQFYRGFVTLGRFKSIFLKGQGEYLNDKNLQKILIVLARARERLAVRGPECVENGSQAWDHAINVELNSADPQQLLLARFLSTRGARLRWETYRKGRPWGTDGEIRTVWHAFNGEKEGNVKLEAHLKRVMFRFVQVWSELLLELFPFSFDSSLEQFLLSEEEEEEQDIGEEQVEKDFGDEEDFEDALEMTIAVPDQQREITPPPLEQGGFVGDSSHSAKMDRAEGAIYIEAFRLFRSELLARGISSETAIAQRWSSARKYVYITMARAALSSRKGHEVTEKSDAFASRYSRILLAQHATLLQAVGDRDLGPLRGPEVCSWVNLSIDSVMEHMLSEQLVISGSCRQVLDAEEKVLAERSTALLNQGLRSGELLRQGRLRYRELETARSPQPPSTGESILEILSRQRRDTALSSLSSAGGAETVRGDGEQLLSGDFRLRGPTSHGVVAVLERCAGSLASRPSILPLAGARVDPCIDGAQTGFNVVARGGARSWTLFADSPTEMDKWIVDIRLAISAASLAERVTLERKTNILDRPVLSSDRAESANPVAVNLRRKSPALRQEAVRLPKRAPPIVPVGSDAESEEVDEKSSNQFLEDGQETVLTVDTLLDEDDERLQQLAEAAETLRELVQSGRMLESPVKASKPPLPSSSVHVLE